MMVLHSVLLVGGCDMIGISVAMVELDVQLLVKQNFLTIKTPSCLWRLRGQSITQVTSDRHWTSQCIPLAI